MNRAAFARKWGDTVASSRRRRPLCGSVGADRGGCQSQRYEQSLCCFALHEFTRFTHFFRQAGQTAIFIAARKAKEVSLLANDHGYSRSSDGHLNEVVAFLVTAGAEFDTVVKVKSSDLTSKFLCSRLMLSLSSSCRTD